MSNHDLFQSGPGGGIGGNKYNIISKLGGDRIKLIQVNWDNNYINGITVQWDKSPSENAGSREGNSDVFDIKSGDFINRIQGSYISFGKDHIIASIQIFTKEGDKSNQFGNDDPSLPTFVYDCPPGYHILGFIGRAGSKIDAIGVYITPESKT